MAEIERFLPCSLHLLTCISSEQLFETTSLTIFYAIVSQPEKRLTDIIRWTDEVLTKTGYVPSVICSALRLFQKDRLIQYGSFLLLSGDSLLGLPWCHFWSYDA